MNPDLFTRGMDDEDLGEQMKAAVAQDQLDADARLIEAEQLEEQATAEAQPQQQSQQTTPEPEPEPTPEPEAPKGSAEEEFGTPRTFGAGVYNPETHTISGGSAKHAAFAGVIDTGIGLINMIPGVDLPRMPKYEQEWLQGTKEIGGVLIPAILGGGALVGAGKAANVAVGANIGKSALVQRLGEAGVMAGTGALVDYASEAGEGDNASASLKKAWPKTYAWIPEDWATQPGDSLEEKRVKTVNEGLGLGIWFDALGLAAKYGINKKNLDFALRWFPENEKATKAVKRLNKELEAAHLDPLQAGEVKRQTELTELGQYNLTKSTNLDEPIFGVHDVYDQYESGIRTLDNGGIVGVSVDQVRISKNIETLDGRVGTVMTEGALKATLDGVADPNTYYKVLRGLAGQIEDMGQYAYKTAGGRYIPHKEIMDIGDGIAADLANMDVAEMKRYFDRNGLSFVDGDIGVSVLKSEAYAGVFKAINGYLKEFANMDQFRAAAYTETSFAGQVSDMSEGIRLMDGTSAVERGQEQVLDRLEFLMAIKGQTSYARGRGLNMLNLWNRMTKSGSEAADMKYAKQLQKGIKDEKNGTLRSLMKIQAEAKETMDTLRAISSEKPEMLAPLLMAYEHTDGAVSTVAKLNNYVKQSTDVFKKLIIDKNPEIPSLVVQGLWSNVYNSILSAVATPVKAVFSGTQLIAEQPLAVAIGALRNGDTATLRRAGFIYGGVMETLSNSIKHGADTWKKAVKNPSDIPAIQRADFQKYNERQMEIVRATANALAEDGEMGATMIADQTEALLEMGNSPWLKYGINGMSAWDGFLTSVQANWTARAKVYDTMISDGTWYKPAKQRVLQKRLRNEFFTGADGLTLKDEAVSHASREMNMNLKGDTVQALNTVLRQVPGLKPFLMFPSTSTNMIKFAGSHQPLGFFVQELNQFKRPFSQVDQFEAEELLASRGIKFDANAEANYEHIRAELLGRKGIGTVAVMGAMALVMNGRIHGDGHFDKETQKVRDNLDWKKRSIQGLDGKWNTFAELGAVGDWMALVANIADNFDVAFTGKNGTLDDVALGTMLNKAGHILSASLVNKSVMSGLEPLFDMTSGNGAALARWAASFGSGLAPLSGQRAELGRLLSPQVKEMEQELGDLIANRNVGARGSLPNKYDIVDGEAAGEPENFMQRIVNTYSPIKQYKGISPEKQFLIDIEFDILPTLKTNGKGVEYDNEQRSALGQEIGRLGYFKKAIAAAMKTPEGTDFRKKYREAQLQGLEVDKSNYSTLHRVLKTQLRAAVSMAQAAIDSDGLIGRTQGLNKEYADAEQRGDTTDMARIQGLLQMKIK